MLWPFPEVTPYVEHNDTKCTHFTVSPLFTAATLGMNRRTVGVGAGWTSNRTILLTRRPNPDVAPNQPVTLRRHQLAICYVTVVGDRLFCATERAVWRYDNAFLFTNQTEVDFGIAHLHTYFTDKENRAAVVAKATVHKWGSVQRLEFAGRLEFTAGQWVI